MVEVKAPNTTITKVSVKNKFTDVRIFIIDSLKLNIYFSFYYILSKLSSNKRKKLKSTRMKILN